MMQFTEEQRKALIDRLTKFRAGIQAARDANIQTEVDEIDDMIAEIALASLTAEAIGRVDRGEVSENNEYPDARVVCLHEQADWENFQDGTELFLRPAPAINLAKLVPDGPSVNDAPSDMSFYEASIWLSGAMNMRDAILRNIEKLDLVKLVSSDNLGSSNLDTDFTVNCHIKTCDDNSRAKD